MNLIGCDPAVWAYLSYVSYFRIGTAELVPQLIFSILLRGDIGFAATLRERYLHLIDEMSVLFQHQISSFVSGDDDDSAVVGGDDPFERMGASVLLCDEIDDEVAEGTGVLHTDGTPIRAYVGSELIRIEDISYPVALVISSVFIDEIKIFSDGGIIDRGDTS